MNEHNYTPYIANDINMFTTLHDMIFRIIGTSGSKAADQ